MTAHFHYEEEVNLTFHLHCVMRVIRKRGPGIKETLRSCPRRRCRFARKPITRSGFRDSCAAANEGALKGYRLFQIDRTVTPARTQPAAENPRCQLLVSITAVRAASAGQLGAFWGSKVFSRALKPLQRIHREM